MTVADLEQRMSNAEYVRWSVYLGRKAQRQQLGMQKAKASAKGRK